MELKTSEIIQEATQLFQRYGIKSISMEELARQMGISKKTLYQHFTDKTELVDKAVAQMVEKNRCNFKNLYNEGLNALEEMFRVYNIANEMIKEHNPGFEFDLKRFYPSIYKKVRDLHRSSMYQSTLSNLEKGKSDGFYRLNFDSQVIAKLHVLRIENLMHTDIIPSEEIHSDHFFKEVFKYHLYGVISQKGHEYINQHYPEFTSNE